MYRIEFKDSKYNKLEFVCDNAVEMCGLISGIYRYTTDENLSFTGCQIIPTEFEPMDDDLGETFEEK